MKVYLFVVIIIHFRKVQANIFICVSYQNVEYIVFFLSLTGHCIGIAESGILIEINCAQYFAHGCPLEDYNSSQLYNCM